MRTRFNIFTIAIATVLVTALIASCSTSSSNSSRSKPKSTSSTTKSAELRERLIRAPNKFVIEIDVVNSRITRNTIINKDTVESAAGTIIFYDRGIYNGQLAFIFSASRLEDGAYYVAEMPSQLSGSTGARGLVNGTFRVTAVKRYRKNFSLEGEPPSQFTYQIRVRNGTIVDEEIMNAMPWWGQFELQPPNTEKKILIMKNRKYPSMYWAGSYSNLSEDGRYEIVMYSK